MGESGCLWKLMAKKISTYHPTNIYEEFECSMDEKFRVLLPAALKKQIDEQAENTFKILRGSHKNLIVFPLHDWNEFSKKLNALNKQNPRVAKAVRQFTSGLTTVVLDAGGRLLLPKNLCEEKGVKKDIVINGMGNSFEIWEKKEYMKSLKENEPESLQLIDEIIGGMDVSNQEN